MVPRAKDGILQTATHFISVTNLIQCSFVELLFLITHRNCLKTC